jgi:hypothetical protein
MSAPYNTPSPTQPRRLVGYPRARQVLDRPNLLVDHPRGTPMPSIAIYGDSGMGKTMIMKRFRDQHPPSFNSLTGRLKTPVLAMEMTSRPGERRFYAELLTSSAHHSGRAPISPKWSKLRCASWKPFFEATFLAGGSPVRFVVPTFRALAGVTAPLPSVATTMLR